MVASISELWKVFRCKILSYVNFETLHAFFDFQHHAFTPQMSTAMHLNILLPCTRTNTHTQRPTHMDMYTFTYMLT
jgi:hypothetical protein